MLKADAIRIVKDIHTDAIDPDEKLSAIQEVAYMETHNSVTKQELIECLLWLLEDYL